MHYFVFIIFQALIVFYVVNTGYFVACISVSLANRPMCGFLHKF